MNAARRIDREAEAMARAAERTAVLLGLCPECGERPEAHAADCSLRVVGLPPAFSDADKARAFFLGGDARFTLVSWRTGARYTYRVRVGQGDRAPHFVLVLTGSNNESDYTFLGTIFEGRDYRHGRNSTIGLEAPSARAFGWAWRWLAAGKMPPECDVHHEGRCGRCGRALTTPESIESGFGPVCIGMGS